MNRARRIVTEGQVWAAVIASACLIYLAILLASHWNSNKPPLTRDQLRVVKGSVYATRENFRDKQQLLASVEVSVRTPSGGSWTGVVSAPVGMRGGPEIHEILTLTGRAVELRADERSIIELMESDRALVPLRCQAPFAEGCLP